MTREEFITASRNFIENKDYLVIDRCVDFNINVIQVMKQEDADKYAFGITFMEQIITFRQVPKDYEYQLEHF